MHGKQLPPVRVPENFPSAEQLSGQVALITGAGRGIGRPIAVAMASYGANIIACGRNKRHLDEVVDEVRARGREALAVPMDVREPESIQAAVNQGLKHFGQIDILVNNAGVSSRQRPEEVTIEEWRRVMDTNVAGPFFVAQAVAHHMMERHQGVIINISSILGASPNPVLAVYSISKAAVIHMTRALAIAWAPYGIRVNSVAPGFIDSPLNAYRKGTPLEEEVIQGTPLRRWGQVEDVAMACVYLASPAAAFITGHTLFVDGGRSAL